MMQLPVLTASEAAAWDSAARTSYRIPGRVLMESAGRACASVIATRYVDVLGGGVLVVSGSGNNGGDGWVVARALHAAGARVWVYALEPKTEDAQASRTLAKLDGVRELAPDEPFPSVGLAVDALLGTGATGELRGGIAECVARLAALEVPVVAVDGPTGLDLTSGAVFGPLHADLTVTFGGVRRGHLLARDRCGDIVVADIGFPPPDGAWPELVTDQWAARHLPPLQEAMHKGQRGRVVVIGGASGMSGAALHAVSGAFAAGVGLVRLIASADTIRAAQAANPDILTTVSALGGEPEAEVLQAVDWADALVIGPGLGRDSGRTAFLGEVLAHRDVPAILDADALTVSANASAALAARLEGRESVITPHQGEFETLFADLAELLATDRWQAGTDAARRLNTTVLIKGVPTVVRGQTGGGLTVAAGNPGLATGGSGDVLAGLIGAFLGRGLRASVAAALGAQALGRAAELGAEVRTARALRPADLVQRFPDLWRAWEAIGPGEPPVLYTLDRPATL